MLSIQVGLQPIAVVEGVKNTSGIVFLIAAARARFGKWDVINSAIGDTGRTIRLVIILVATALPAATMAVLVDLLVRR